jgi:hypothetical protein
MSPPSLSPIAAEHECRPVFADALYDKCRRGSAPLKSAINPFRRLRLETSQQTTDSDPHGDSRKLLRLTARPQRAKKSSVFSEDAVPGLWE